MQEIHDEKRIEYILRQESKYFQKRTAISPLATI